MGKYTKKAKMTLDVSLMDVSQSYLGVRTRAKTLALQRLQSAASPLPPPNPDDCYLELRSRRLQKPMQLQNSRNIRRSCDCSAEDDAEIETHEECSGTGFVSGSGPIEAEGLGIETSFGENNLDFEVRDRGTRESTPCRGGNIITTPGSTTKRTFSSADSQRVVQNTLVESAPCAWELEEFFAREEQSMQRHFIEKYNFDVVKDLPLPGRYEWVAVRP